MALVRKIRCVVASIQGLGGGVYVVDLKPASPAPNFKAGQFLHLTLDEYSPSAHWPESRAFSIASSPDQHDLIQICYSVKGRYTARMEHELKTGGTVWIKMPFGDFFIDETRDVALLAGGTGLSAFSAFIANLRTEHPRNVFLAYGVRSPSHWLFKDLVLRQMRAVARFRAGFFCESAEGSALSVPDDLAGRLSYHVPERLAVSSIWPQLANPKECGFYLSGPPQMLANLSAALRAAGVASDRIKIDAWS